MKKQTRDNFYRLTRRIAFCILLIGSVGSFFAGYIVSKNSIASGPRSVDFESAQLVSSQERGPTTLEEAEPVASSEKDGLPWDVRWAEVATAVGGPARLQELESLIEELAKVDPQRALRLAGSESNWRVSAILNSAALRGWASVDPDAAADHAMVIRAEDRRAAVAAVLQGSAIDPEATVRIAMKLCEADPEPAGDYGHSAIAALADKGAFSEAVRFGEEMGYEAYPYLAKSAYFQWARNQPELAIAACSEIEDPRYRAKALGEVVSGWAWANPKGLASYAMSLPEGADRTASLSEALPLWIEREPESAIAWLETNDTGPAFDAGVAALASMQSMVVYQPGSAMEIASEIYDPALRERTMKSVFRQWVERDPVMAQSFLSRQEHLEDRGMLEAELRDFSEVDR